MKLAVMQPYFFPYIGYWQLIGAVDTFVIYDDVNYIKGGWINRNRILVNNREHMLTLDLKGASPNKRINEIEIGGNREKLLKTVAMAYRRAPQYGETMPLIERILRDPEPNLALFLERAIREICDRLRIQTRVLVSSQIDKNATLRAQNKILDICARLHANTYINAIGGQDLYDSSTFNEHGVELAFIESCQVSYKQFGSSFVPSLSIIDALMFNSLQTISGHVSAYRLKHQ